MKILAKSKAGHEFIYNPTSAHEVSERSGRTIMDILNRVRYDIKADEVWHIHNVDQYDTAYSFAQTQKFTIRNGVVTRRYTR